MAPGGLRKAGHEPRAVCADLDEFRLRLDSYVHSNCPFPGHDASVDVRTVLATMASREERWRQDQKWSDGGQRQNGKPDRDADEGAKDAA